jgi:hypothetical protein
MQIEYRCREVKIAPFFPSLDPNLNYNFGSHDPRCFILHKLSIRTSRTRGERLPGQMDGREILAGRWIESL